MQYSAHPSTSPLSLHDALPICGRDRLHGVGPRGLARRARPAGRMGAATMTLDPASLQVLISRLTGIAEEMGAVLRRAARSESTRLNSSHTVISYAVFCLKKKNK